MQPITPFGDSPTLSLQDPSICITTAAASPASLASLLELTLWGIENGALKLKYAESVHGALLPALAALPLLKSLEMEPGCYIYSYKFYPGRGPPEGFGSGLWPHQALGEAVFQSLKVPKLTFGWREASSATAWIAWLGVGDWVGRMHCPGLLGSFLASLLFA